MPIAAVQIARSLQRALDALLGFIPNIIGFLIILLVGYIIARLVRAVVSRALHAIGVDRMLHKTPVGPYMERISPSAHPSALVAAVIFWFIFIFAIVAATGALKIPALTNFMANVQNYLPNVVAAIVIFVIGAVIAGAAGGFADRLMGDTSTGRVARTVLPGLILAIVVFMVLNQLKIAPTIVATTYVALIGMLALAGALAFGLGGRDVAAELLRNAYDSAQENQDTIRQDLRTGRERARNQMPQPGGSGVTGDVVREQWPDAR